MAAHLPRYAIAPYEAFARVIIRLHTLLVASGWPIADPIASIVVATVIAVSALGLFRENASFLLGRSPGKECIDNLERTARSVPGVLGVHDVRAEYIGPDVVHAGMHLAVPADMPVSEANKIAEEVRRAIRDRGRHQARAPDDPPCTEDLWGFPYGSDRPATA